MQMAGPAFMDYFLNGRSRGPGENRHPLGAAAPHGVFPCAGDDRWIAIAVLTDAEWRGLSQAISEQGSGKHGGPGRDIKWALDQAYTTADGRIAAIDEIHERLAAWTATADDYELAAALQRRGVPATPVLNVADLLSDPHYKARRTFIEVQHPLGFTETIYGAYVKMSRTPAAVRPGPVIGQDNERVFKGLLGLSEGEYKRLIAEQVIY
jgi:benzylsuccinate CoA-transferase BbsF subunit